MQRTLGQLLSGVGLILQAVEVGDCRCVRFDAGTRNFQRSGPMRQVRASDYSLSSVIHMVRCALKSFYPNDICRGAPKVVAASIQAG